MFKRFVHGLGRNFVEGDATNRVSFRQAAQLIFQMSRDRFSFAIRIRRQINGRRRFGQFLQPVNYLFFSRDDNQFGRKTAVA
jgi:hypothetical protein